MKLSTTLLFAGFLATAWTGRAATSGDILTSTGALPLPTNSNDDPTINISGGVATITGNTIFTGKPRMPNWGVSSTPATTPKMMIFWSGGIQTADFTAGILQSALTGAFGLGAGQVIYLPAATITLTSTLSIPASTTIIGAQGGQTVFSMSSSSPTTSIFTCTGNGSVFKSIGFSRDTATTVSSTTGAGIDLAGYSQIKIRDCLFQYQNAGVKNSGSTPCTDIEISNTTMNDLNYFVKLDDQTTSSSYLSGNRIRLYDDTFTNSRIAGIRIATSGCGVGLKDCEIRDCVMTTGVGDALNVSGSNIRIEHLLTQGFNGNAISINTDKTYNAYISVIGSQLTLNGVSNTAPASWGGTWTPSTYYSNDPTGVNGHGIYVSDVDPNTSATFALTNFEVVNTVVGGSASSGIALKLSQDDANSMKNIKLVNNRIYNSCQAPNSGDAGIQLDQSYGSITKCQLLDNVSSQAASTYPGFAWGPSPPITGIINLSNNDLSGNGAQSTLPSAVTDEVVVGGNLNPTP